MPAPSDFDAMGRYFSEELRAIAEWKHAYFGAAYSTRIRAAIAHLRQLIAEIESHPEIGPPKEPR